MSIFDVPPGELRKLSPNRLVNARQIGFVLSRTFPQSADFGKSRFARSSAARCVNTDLRGVLEFGADWDREGQTDITARISVHSPSPSIVSGMSASRVGGAGG